MDQIGDAIQGLINLLDMLGALVRKAWSRKSHPLNKEFRSRDNTWLGAATLLILGLLVIFLFGCGQDAGRNSSYNASGFNMGKDETAALDTTDTAVKVPPSERIAQHECDPTAFMRMTSITSLAQRITNGKDFSLANDTEALALLDSMLNGSRAEVREFYFWIVTKSLERSDGYYSEGVGSWGTAFLFNRPDEFLKCWRHCINTAERRKWTYYLAAEEHICSEGYPVDLVMNEYYIRLDSIVKRLPEEHLQTSNLLFPLIDSTYRILAQNDRPIGPSSR